MTCHIVAKRAGATLTPAGEPSSQVARSDAGDVAAGIQDALGIEEILQPPHDR